MKKKILLSAIAFFIVIANPVFCMKDMSIQTLTGHTNKVVSVKFHMNSKILVSRSIDGVEKLWIKNNNSQWVFIKDLPPKKINRPKVIGVFSIDYKHYVPLDGNNSIEILEKDPNNRFVLFDRLIGHTASVNSVEFSLDRKLLISGSDDKTIKLWTKKRGILFSLLNTLKGHAAAVNSVTISPDKTIFASGSSDNTVKIWTNPPYVDPKSKKTKIKKTLFNGAKVFTQK